MRVFSRTLWSAPRLPVSDSGSPFCWESDVMPPQSQLWGLQGISAVSKWHSLSLPPSSSRGLFLSRALLWNFFHSLPEPLTVFAVVSESLALLPSFNCEPPIHNLTVRLSMLGEVLQQFLLPTPFFFSLLLYFLFFSTPHSLYNSLPLVPSSLQVLYC